ncbi:MAG TPA: Rad52/Rad22 family DNA repair protein [Gemmatimonadaceae bacterium]|nr:Rad52/Rad22 family DNA repair protein [Gemmatimonadaceae bacterium]
MIAANDIYKAPADVWARLAEPVPVESISWRQDGKPITRDGKFFARFVAYIEANTVRERLDTVVPGEWDLTLTPLPTLVSDDPAEPTCSFKARLQVLGVVREDVGTGRDYKSAATDAFKRAAVRFGIAHELYSYGTNWVEVDGDGKFAKPIEDPAAAYARRNGGTAAAAASPAKRPALALDEETCPKCGGRMWDNRLTKRNPRAPDYKCRDRSCDGVIWPPRDGEKKVAEAPAPQAKTTEEPAKDWQPLNSAPLIPDAELPF